MFHCMDSPHFTDLYQLTDSGDIWIFLVTINNEKFMYSLDKMVLNLVSPLTHRYFQ